MDTTIKKPDKKSLLYLAIVLAIALLVFAGLLYYLYLVSKPGPVIDEEAFKELQRQKIIKKQMEELANFREDAEPLTGQEIQKQLKELEQFRGKTEPLSEEEAQKQLEELNKFR